ncbi:hypothetical protein [uncultured Roseovarius sp.]|uniref:hypothetical protein n=1 Tax=uncultured Roseovarius sp. TaxID=293344 RepID=UPI002596588A|nr:hypothetical protein [uncultured Roseovarius sp.]
MLAAASSRSDRTLDSVKLVLRLEAARQNYPEPLKQYLQNVVKQANDLMDRPEEVASETSPEAVSLAVKFSSDEALRRALQAILGEGDISSDDAALALESLETSFDPIGESAHFGREIYAAI